jgi:hypothetical protein
MSKECLDTSTTISACIVQLFHLTLHDLSSYAGSDEAHAISYPMDTGGSFHGD